MEFLKLLESIRNPFLDFLFLTVTHLGEELVFLALAIVIFWCVSKREGYYILITGLVGTVVNQSLKLICRVRRPWTYPGFSAVEGAIGEATGYSFPSGHTQNVVGTLGGMARWTRRLWLRITLIVLAVLVAFSRMYLGVHTPLDVFVSLAVAAMLVFALYPLFKTEESFKRKLSDCFKKMCHRRNWIYIGVWERSTNNNRLHFHGLFNIPENAMVDELVEHRDYSTKMHRMQTTLQNSYFTERFGRNDFEPINKQELPNATAYLMKYIEKSGERIVYSKNTPAYFVSDILDDDVVCTIGQEDRKLLLFDNFICFDDGVYIGEVSPEVIKQMPKKN